MRCGERRKGKGDANRIEDDSLLDGRCFPANACLRVLQATTESLENGSLNSKRLFLFRNGILRAVELDLIS